MPFSNEFMWGIKTPCEWMALLYPDNIILDPDGWRGEDELPFETPITRQAFLFRFARSTIAPKDSGWSDGLCG